VLATLVQIYSFVLLIRILLSWFPVDRYNPVVSFLYDITEPVLEPLRRVIPPAGMMDFSPMVAFLLLWILRVVLMNMATSF
jgi:YggT family protein